MPSNLGGDGGEMSARLYRLRSPAKFKDKNVEEVSKYFICNNFHFPGSFERFSLLTSGTPGKTQR